MSEPERPADLATALRQAIGPYVEFLHAFEDFRSQIRTWVADHQPELEALRVYLQHFAKLDWRDIDRQVHEAELKLAEFGWTIPGWMYRQDVLEMSKRTPAEIDAAMTARFMNDDAKELEQLRAELLQAQALAQWHALIEEIVASIKAGHNRVAVHASLSVLDGYVTKSLTGRYLMKPTETALISKLNEVDWHRTDIQEPYFCNPAYRSCAKSSSVATSRRTNPA